MTNTHMDMPTLYDRLSHLGFPKKFLRETALPDWWDTELEANPEAAVTAAAYISRRLNLDIASLLQPEITPAFKQSCQPKFKTKQGTDIQQLQAAQCMAARVAEMVAYACVPEFQDLPKSAIEIRDRILAQRDFVNLAGLLEFCWNSGIPVVAFHKFPPGQRKFDGMVGYFHNRPAIVLSLKHRSAARLLFILAHELGHLVKGHLQGNTLVDENVEPENTDLEETEASEFALELLLGKIDIGYYTPRNFSGDALANYAQKISQRDKVDPGVVTLNYAWHKANAAPTKNQKDIAWATASKALKILEGDARATNIINQYIIWPDYLNLEKLDYDSQDYLEFILEE